MKSDNYKLGQIILAQIMKIYDAQKNNENLLFAVATSIIVGNGDNISFWHIAWFQGLRPCDFTPSVHKLSRKKE